jgi:HEPN domain-containing protein
MDEPLRKFVEAWLIKARNDLATAHKLASGTDPYLDTAIYHTQQAAEKALKGFLTFHHQQIVKTHDIRFLLGKAILIEDRRLG